jgi:rubrerythrin
MKSKYPMYKCLKCDYEWDQIAPSQVVCPVCNNVYVKWMNFEEWRKENMSYPYN